MRSALAIGVASFVMLSNPAFAADSPHATMMGRVMLAVSSGDAWAMLPGVIWAEAPTRADVAAAAPSTGSGGDVLLQCRLDQSGALHACETITTKSNRLADAAQRLVPRFRVNMASVGDADLKEAGVFLPVHFLAAPAAEPGVLSQPEWTRAFPPDKLQQVFPPKAAEAGLKTGRAVLNCVADAQGAMTACQVVSEDPAGMDFGPAAVRVAAAMAVNPWSRDGAPAEGSHVQFAIRLNDQEPTAGSPPKP